MALEVVMVEPLERVPVIDPDRALSVVVVW
jgi:hypothetical protein